MATRFTPFLMAVFSNLAPRTGMFLSKYDIADREIKLRENKLYEIHVQSLFRLLSFRDLETKEHTRRVTALAFRFARWCDLPKKDLIHIRRGALLHDIGKQASREYGIKATILSRWKQEFLERGPRLSLEFQTVVAENADYDK